ncbi:hypothetical protein [Saccharomonospora cyanea]|uniref:Uncharacterized protein n=1 Tax=Saccharomonospora cyanea NA-134 TaxID=882082 RepID=H5XI91_9PSEU|nr:hypothetical protein [Saccharomonospora cyanea]EHR61719.1 hypothetical protein SaccyDRAFT_2873 [Saccharomonospora cyanea NA-134]
MTESHARPETAATMEESQPIGGSGEQAGPAGVVGPFVPVGVSDAGMCVGGVCSLPAQTIDGTPRHEQVD